MTIDKVFLNRLRRLGICEAISTLVLLGIAVPLKYLGEMPLAVEIVGPIHGFLFVCLVGTFLVAVKKVPISSGLAFAGIVAAVFPFGPFLIDRKLAEISVED
jgi:integral membrane protein